MISDFCDETIGYDFSPQLISQAYKKLGTPTNFKIRFAIADVIRYQLRNQYDLVSCMGVTSTLILENYYLKVLNTLSTSLKFNGLLLMQDSLQKNSEHEIINHSDYSAIYRSREYYIKNIENLGLTLVTDITLSEDDSRINKLFLFKKI